MGGFQIMNTLVIVLIAAIFLSAAYVLYGRWIASKWGIDAKAITPAKRLEDGNVWKTEKIMCLPMDGLFSVINFLLLPEPAL